MGDATTSGDEIGVGDNPVIISKICTFLDVSTLKTVRTLSKVWLKGSTPTFVSLTKAALLPSACDDAGKWKSRLAEYESLLEQSSYGHTNFAINTNAFAVSNFNYEEQMLRFATLRGGHIRSLQLTIKLKTGENFRFFVGFLGALEGYRGLEDLSLCLCITKPNYNEADLPDPLPGLVSVASLALSVPQGTHWPCPSVNPNPNWEPRVDFATKILSMFPCMKSLTLGEDLVTVPLNLEYLASLAKATKKISKSVLEETVKGVAKVDEIVEVEVGVKEESKTPLLSTSTTTKRPPNEGVITPRVIFQKEIEFPHLKEIDLLITHSHMLVHLLELGIMGLEKLTLGIGQQQNMPTSWDQVRINLEQLLDKHKESLESFSLNQLGLPEWKIWELSLPPCPKLQRLSVASNCSVPSGDPITVEESKGRIRLQDLFRMGSSSLETNLPNLVRVEMRVHSYSREIFDRLLPQEGVAQFPRLVSVLLSLPPMMEVGEHSLGTQRLVNLFPNARQSLWKNE